MGFVKKSPGGSALCARGRTGQVRHQFWCESVARTQLERRENSACTKPATSCLRLCGGSSHHLRIPKFGSRFLQVDSTHLQVRRVVTVA